MTRISLVLLVFTLLANLVRPDDYVEELKHRCNFTRKAYACTKYRLFELMDHEGLLPENTPKSFGGLVRLVKIERQNYDVGLFGEARYYGGDSELMKIIKYVQRKAVKFLEGQAMSFALPDGARVVDVEDNEVAGDEARRKKGEGGKKKEMLIPLIMLFKLFKIKVLVSLVLLSVLFIKKTILLTAMFLPSVIQSIKNHCKTSYHVVPHHIEDEHHEHDISGAGWGYSGKEEYEEEPYRRSRRKADFLKTDELSLNLSHYIASLWKKIREFFVDLGL
ncbi:uncharacterized protein LOC123680163 [Harmonia axyridis]|uniref:uncharacterized protein LOC123680163 n=1 Tax=Harmonia axyridis TaxID=115357 RepID=UPI001E279C75|nr:uncharacterized protein LOC123680163 [Harmonia axyridis]